MPANLDGLFWLLLSLGPLLILQRSLHREIQAVFLLITRRGDISVALFSLLFFPGVLFHEGSHYVVARLVGVRTGRLSFLPRPIGNGKLRLGFVETAATDWARDALIGAAPLITGGIVVAYVGLAHLGLATLWQQLRSGYLAALPVALSGMLAQPDFWLWFYLVVTVSSTMLPSASDRRAWLPIGLIMALLLGISLLFGAGPWLASNLASPLNRVLQAVAVVFGISVLVHLVLLPPWWILHRLLARLTGMDVV
jgi:hypothetical protein